MCEVLNNMDEKQVHCEYGQAFCPEGGVNTEHFKHSVS